MPRCASSSPTASPSSPSASPAAATPRLAAARHQRHGDHARQRPPRPAALRPQRGRRADRAGRLDARDRRAPVAHVRPPSARTLPCIGSERADLVVAGCAILESILDIWPADAARRRRPRHSRRHPAQPDGGEADGMSARSLERWAGWRRADWHAGQDRARAHRVVDPLARAPAQRSLRQAGQGRGLPQPRGLQADRARRALRAC